MALTTNNPTFVKNNSVRSAPRTEAIAYAYITRVR